MLLIQRALLSASLAVAVGCVSVEVSAQNPTPTTASTPAAITIGHYTFAPTMKVGNEDLVLNGAGMRSILFIKVYAAGLYLPKPAHTAADVLAQPGNKRIRLVMHRDIDGVTFIDALHEGIKNNQSEETQKALVADINALTARLKAVGNLKEGDIVDLDYTPQQGTTVLLNGKTFGDALPGAQLYNALLMIWLGARPIDSDLRDELLK